MKILPNDDSDESRHDPRRFGSTPQASAELAWGSVGTHHQAGNFEECGGPGVQRIAGDGVDYYPPPLTWRWTPVRDRPQHYVMAWPGDPHQVRTLASLGAELRAAQAHKTLSSESASLHQFDQLVQQLLALADNLHQEGWGLGLIHPDNVLITETTDPPEVVLVDLGFVWTSGTPAPWIEDNPHQRFWEPSAPKTRQHAEPILHQGEERKPRDAVAVAGDLRTLARLLAAVLTGTTTFSPPRNAAPVWKTLQAAFDNKFPSARAFADALKTTPPSQHFLSRSGSAWAMVAAVVATAVVLTAIVIPLVWRGSPGETGGTATATASQAAWDSYLADWMTRYNALIKRINPEDRNFDLERFTLSREFQQLYDDLIAKQKQHPDANTNLTPEQQQCLTNVANQARDLGIQ